MNYKPSYYNYIAKIGNGKTLLYNLLTESLVELEEDQIFGTKYLLEKDNCNKDLSEDLKSIKERLIENYYLVSEDTNELDTIKTLNMKERFNHLNYTLTIMPTLDCNFACKYCYEERKKGFMDQSVIKGIKNWIDQIANINGNLSISWFGGEPLLNFSIVEELNGYAKKILEEKNLMFTSGVTSNGYLIDDNILGKIECLNINHFQITIDGTEEYHNIYRPLRDGKETFERVYKNILSVLDRTQAKVFLRVNVDMENYQSVYKLIDMIPDKYKNGKLKMYFRGIFQGPNEKLCNNLEINKKQVRSHEILKDLYVYAIQNNIQIMMPLLSSKKYYCETCLANQYVINPIGEIFKCTVEFEVGKKLGEITDDGQMELDFFEYSKWLSHVAGEDEKCATCIFLPKCFGGCRYQRTLGKLSCPPESDDIDGLVEILYLSTIREQMPINI